MMATQRSLTPRRRRLLLPLLLGLAAVVLVAQGEDFYEEALGRPGPKGFAIHSHAERQQGQAFKPLRMNPKFLSSEHAQPARVEKPSAYNAKLEQGKELRYGGAGGVGRDEKQALELFKEVANASEAASSERLLAVYEAALLHTSGGTNVPQDLAMAVETLSGALEFAEAKHILAFYVATGFGNKPADEEGALKLEVAAAEGGSIAAALGLAFRFLYGLEGVVEPDCGKALEIYKSAARVVVEDFKAIVDLKLKRHVDEVSWLEARRAHMGDETDEAARKRLLAAAAAKEASGEALYEVAKMYDAGEYKMVPNPKKALEFYQAAAAMGHAGAMADLGILYAMGTSSESSGEDGQTTPMTLDKAGLVQQDLEMAVDLLERAAELGDAHGMTALAHMYLEGAGVDRDEEKAHILFEQAALKDNAEALSYYGERLLADKRDVASAMAAFHRSGVLGNAAGAYREGTLLIDGVEDDMELPPDVCTAAAEAFKRAAESGFWNAGPRFGMELYKRGEHTAALAVLAVGAEEGYELAQANAAYMLANRMGYEYDDADELALRLYERAAMQSDAHLYALGDLMLRMEAQSAGEGATTGPGFVSDGVTQALSYMEAAAESGDVRALKRLAEMHEQGKENVGVGQDTKKALEYYRALLAALSSSSEGVSAENEGWAAFVDKKHVQWKVTALSVKKGVGTLMGGQDGAPVRGLDDMEVVRGKGKAEGWMKAK